MMQEFQYVPDSRYSHTANNLIMAFNREATASFRYAIYAKKAKADNYQSVASLFEACSFSEQIHSARHAKVAIFMGVPITAVIHPTHEEEIPDMLGKMLAFEIMANLIYPDLIEEAEEEGNKFAVLSFSGAMKAEQTHITLCREAIDSQNYWRYEGRHFYVCPLCGLTRESHDSKCDFCGASAEKFIEF